MLVLAAVFGLLGGSVSTRLQSVAAATGEVLRTTRVEFVDASGLRRAILGVDSNNRKVLLSFISKDGNTVASFGLASDDLPFLDLNGTDGKARATFEGIFLSAKCEADGRVTIQGARWLSAIAVVWNDPKENQEAFPADDVTIRQKLVALKSEHDESEQHTGESRHPPDPQPRTINFDSHWVAVFGVLNSPPRLRPPQRGSGPSKRNIPGNGYGANGSVPAKILASAEKALD
jgi:hypothetical protein